MQSSAERDEKTLVISTALGLFILIVLAGAAALWAVHLFVDVSDALTSGLLITLVCASGLASVWYMLRARQRE